MSLLRSLVGVLALCLILFLNWILWPKGSGPQMLQACIPSSSGGAVRPSWSLPVVTCYSQGPDLKPILVPDLNGSREDGRALISYYTSLFNVITQSCGPTCDTTGKRTKIKSVSDWPFDFVRRNVDCPALFLQSAFDAPAWRWPPPKLTELPDFMVKAFTLDGTYPLFGSRFFTQRYSGGEAKVSRWGRDYVNDMVTQAKNRTLVGTYTVADTNCLLETLSALKDDIEGKHFAVVGSQNPWVEACLLSVGARHVTTIEYGRIVSEHPQLSTFTPTQFNSRVFASDFEPFDGVVTFSSVEHSGLGRYGDELNPWGDLIAIQRMWCVTKPNGLLVNAVMTALSGQNEGIEGNLHRFYGKIRYPLLTANWYPRRAGCGGQKVLAFTRLDVDADSQCGADKAS